MPSILPYQRQVADPSGVGFTPQASNTDYVAQGLQTVAGGLGAVGAELKEKDDRAKAVQSTLALATMNNDLRDAHAQVAQDVQSGKLDPTQATSAFQQQASTIRDSAFTGLTPQQQASLSPSFVGTSGELSRSLDSAVFARGQSDVAASIDAFGEQVQRSAVRIGPAAAAEKFAAFVDFAGGDAGLTPEKAAKLKQSFSENVHFNAFQTAGVNAYTSGDVGGVDEALRQLKSPDGDALDPTKRAVLEHQLYGYGENLRAKQLAAENAQIAEQNRREAAATKSYNDTLDLLAHGQTLDAGFIKQVTETASGTSLQGDIGDLLGKQSVITGFATKTAPDRAALLNNLEAQSVTAGTNPAAYKMLKELHGIDDGIKTAQAANPWAAAQASGVIANAPAFDASKPDNAFQIIQQRNADIAKVEQWTGTKVNPFQPQEVMQLAKAVKSMPPEQQAPYLGALGQSIGDLDRINMVATELDKSNKPMALALKLGTDLTTSGRTAAQYVLTGAQALEDKTVKRDDTTLSGWRADIASKVRGTMGDPQMEDDIINAAYYTRAAFDKQGIEAPGFSIDKTNDQAIRMVIGDPMERAGVKTILPRGYDEQMFNTKLKTLTPAVLSAVSPNFFSRGQPITPIQLSNRLMDFGMKRDGAGKYIPVNNGAPITVDAAGTNPLRITVQ